MTLLTQIAALLAIMGSGVVHGTDVFRAIVRWPALARDDDAALTAVMGNLHRLLVVWMVLYARISAPINRAVTAAADNHETRANARMLQRDRDSITVLRATLQGVPVLGLGISLIIT